MRRSIMMGCLWLALAPPAIGAEPKPAAEVRTISTTGDGVVFVAPDEVVVNLGVETAQPELEKASALNDQAGARLVKALQALGVEARHIQTDNLNLEIRYKNGDSLVIAGYVARRGYSVTLKDPQKFQALTETALKNGANRLLGFEYRTTELRKHRDQARQMAIKAAREKAQALAEAVDCQLGAPQSIQEGGGVAGYWGSRWGFIGVNSITQNVAQAAPGGDESGGESVPLGQIGIRASVSATFDLVPFAK